MNNITSLNTPCSVYILGVEERVARQFRGYYSSTTFLECKEIDEKKWKRDGERNVTSNIAMIKS